MLLIDSAFNLIDINTLYIKNHNLNTQIISKILLEISKVTDIERYINVIKHYQTQAHPTLMQTQPLRVAFSNLY